MIKIAFILLWLYVFCIPWDHMFDFGTGIGEISRVFGVLSVVATVGAVLSTGSIRKPAPQHLLAAGFLVSVIASWFWTIDQQETARSIRTCIQTMIVTWQVWQLAPSIEKIRSLLFAFVLGGYVSCLATIQEFRNTFYFRSGLRFKAEGWNENDLAVVLALGISMAAYLGCTSRNRFVRWICWGYLLVGPTAIALTASRAGAVVAALALGSAFLLITKGRWKIKLMVPVLAVVVVGVLLAFVPSTTWDRIATVTSTPDMNNRFPIWERGLRIFADNPLRPLGAGASPAVLGGTGFVAHNAFLGVLLDEGLLGFFCFAAMIACCVVQARRLPAMERLLWYSVVFCWTVGAMTLSWEQVRITWFIFACAAAAIHCDQAGSRFSFSHVPVPVESFAQVD
jgi:O-antigen ligase